MFAGPGPRYLPGLAPNLCLPALAYSFVTGPGTEFGCASLVSSICICICLVVGGGGGGDFFGVGGGDARFFKSFLLVLTKYLFWQEGVKSFGIS